MKIHEYQGKEILRNFGVPVPRGIPAFTVQEAVEAAQKLGGPVWVVKAQIHAGGRGKGGGVKVAKSVDDVKKLAGEILGMQLKTHQTGPEGQKVRRLLHRGRRRHQEGILRLGGDRPRLAEGGVHGLQRRRHGHRGSGACHAREDHQGVRRPARRPHRRPGQGDSPTASASRPTPPPRPWTCSRSSTRCYMDTDASLVEINPLILRRQRQHHGAGRQVQLRLQRAVPPPRDRGAARPGRGRRGRRSKPASSTWPTSAWTATSAAWSTAPAWPWRPWTPSSCSAASPPTSSTWAAAPPPRR